MLKTISLPAVAEWISDKAGIAGSHGAIIRKLTSREGGVIKYITSSLWVAFTITYNWKSPSINSYYLIKASGSIIFLNIYILGSIKYIF